MTVKEAIAVLEADFERRFPGFDEPRERVKRAEEAVRVANEELKAAREAFAVSAGKYNHDDEYMRYSICGLKEALSNLDARKE